MRDVEIMLEWISFAREKMIGVSFWMLGDRG